ncbi:hypothetical protein BKA82DRAFT_4017940 [Pisolithus tinctorius]|nr:hypothetical protein BKA82DRAFT_4017940 [Pisolithus tinctorius]
MEPVPGQLPWHWCCARTHYNGMGSGMASTALVLCQNTLHYNGARMACMMAPWHWGCASTNCKGSGMACMMDLSHWGYARMHRAGAGMASMALGMCRHSLQRCRDGFHDGPVALGICQNTWNWCRYTLQWRQNGLHDRPHGIGDGRNIWHWFQHGFHGIGVVLEHIPMVPGWPA